MCQKVKPKISKKKRNILNSGIGQTDPLQKTFGIIGNAATLINKSQLLCFSKIFRNNIYYPNIPNEGFQSIKLHFQKKKQENWFLFCLDVI